MTSPYTTILVETIERVGVIRLNRPRQRNALNTTLMHEASQALQAFARNPEIRAIVLAAEGPSFSAGFDLKELAQANNTSAAQWAATLQADFEFIIQFWDCPKPTVAAVHGYCIGGGLELALACDLTVADVDSLLGEPEMKFGSSIAALIVPWLVGAKYAKEMLLTANDRISAQRAYEVGLINHVTRDGQHFERALALAHTMAQCAPLSVQLTKRAIHRGFDLQGMRQALLAAVDTATLIEANVRPENVEFERIRSTQGMQAALAWRDAPR